MMKFGPDYSVHYTLARWHHVVELKNYLISKEKATQLDVIGHVKASGSLAHNSTFHCGKSHSWIMFNALCSGQSGVH